MLKIIDEFRWQRKTEENQNNPLNMPENETYDKNAGPTLDVTSKILKIPGD